MAVATSGFDINQIPTLIAAVGALGFAAFAAVESIGKTLFVFDTPWWGGHRSWGLPYVGFGHVRKLVRPLEPALKMAYGAGYGSVLKQQYRDGRSTGQAPETIRQGVRLGLPFLTVGQAADVIHATWGMDRALADRLAEALTAEKTNPDRRGPTPHEVKQYQALAGRFSTALDTRVQATFAVAEQIYETRAQIWAGAVAITLALGYHAAKPTAFGFSGNDWGGWFFAFVVGLLAVPLAPASKDLSSAMSNALSALSKLQLGRKV